LFLPYTGVKTNIIYATKVNQKLKASQKRKDFWYFDVKSDGYTLDNHRRKLDSGSDLDKYQEYRKLDDDQRQDMLDVGFEVIPLNKVNENSHILVGSRYREHAPITSSYEYVELKDVSDIIAGQSPSGEHYNDNGDGVPFYQGNANFGDVYIKSPTKWTRQTTKMAIPGDVLLSVRAPVGAVNICNDSVCIGRGLMAIRSRGGVLNPKYLFFILRAAEEKLQQFSSGSTFAAINKSDVERFKIPLPTLNVQQNIVDELDSYQQIINGARALARNYKPIIPKNITGEVKALGDIAVFRPSKDEVKSLARDTLVSFVPMADMNAHKISFAAKEEKPISEVHNGFTYFKDGDVLLAKITPCFENGKSGIARNLKNGIGFGSTEYIVIRANLDVVYPEWIYYHINSPEFLKQGNENMTGTAGQQRIDINFVKGYSIVVPSLEEQHRVLNEIKTEYALIEPSRQIIEVFTRKMQTKINEIWGEQID